MIEILRLAPAGARALEILEAPGFLQTRQNATGFKLRVYSAVAHILKMFTRYDVIFPLCLKQTADMLDMTVKQFRKVLKILERIGLVDPVTKDGEERDGPIRRCHEGTVSPTPGADGSWYAPGRFRLGMAFRDLFPDLKRIGTEIADSTLESQWGTDDTLEVRESSLDLNENLEEEIGTISAVRAPLTGLDDEEDPADDVDPALEGALEGYRRVRAPAAMPDDRRRPGAPQVLSEADFEAELLARMRLKYAGSALSDEARATVVPSITGSRR